MVSINISFLVADIINRKLEIDEILLSHGGDDMNIEPVSSAMTYQAQTQTTKPVEKTPEVNMDVVTAETEKPVDDMTASVQRAENAGEQENKGSDAKEQQSNETIRQIVDQLNKKMTNSEAVYGIHEKTNRVTIKIVDKETKEVMKEFPPEKTLDMIAKVLEMAGILVDEKG